MANFLGFKQVRLSDFTNLSDAEKKGYLWLVREFQEGSETPIGAAIYFGTRKYAELNKDDNRATEIVKSLGSMVGTDGKWLGFLPLESHTILGDATNASDALEKLEAAIIAAKSSIDAKADKNNVYTKEEIDGKISGAFKFKGDATAISEDKTKITVNEVEILASEENQGYVYQIGEKEYASNGKIWVELGFNVDLSQYATKTEVQDVQTSLTAEIQAREELSGKVDTLSGKVTTIEKTTTLSVDTYEEAAALTDLSLGQIVYIKNGETGGTGHSAGAYIYEQGGLKKLDSSTGTGDTPLSRVESLENKVGNTPLPDGKTLTELMNQIVTLSGGDVEE